MLMLMLGCLPHYPDTAYLARIEVEQATEVAAAQNEARVLNQRLGELLNEQDLTVAFFPPSRCRNNASVSNAGGGALLSTDCGLLMSALEEQAAMNGYQVVSWQFLAGAGAGGALQGIARENGVDVIFEVDYLAITTVQDGETQVSGVDFEKRVSGEGTSPLVVEDLATVGQRCVDNYAGGIQANYQPSVSMSIKAVDADDGRSLWYMRYTGGGGDKAASQVSKTLSFYPKRDYYDPAASSARTTAMLAWLPGIFMAAGGAVGTGLGVALGEDGPPVAPMLLLTVAGAGFTTLGLILTPGGDQYPFVGPEEVLCNPEYAEKATPYGASSASTSSASASGSSWGTERKVAAASPSQDSAQVELTQQAADVVFEELGKVRGEDQGWE